MSRPHPTAGRVAAVLVLLGAAFAGAGLASPPATQSFHTTDTGLCPFPLEVTVATKLQTDQPRTTVLQFAFTGPSTITLRNGTTGRTAKLASPGPFTVDTRTGSVAFSGRQVWFWSTGKRVPFASTQGPGSLRAPYYVLRGAPERTIDPCALVAPAAPSTVPRATPAPWGLPSYALSRIGYAGLTPLIGSLVRHDHAHLDVIVNGRKVVVPGGVGVAEPIDNGPCAGGQTSSGDCATGHIITGLVANSPIHTHSTSGLIHIEQDRPGALTLGQFFDEWGVRLDSSCVGGYCAGGGRQLRVYVNGRRATGNPRQIALEDRQEIAVVFGGPGAFRSVPASYRGGWPGPGCGGPGEHSCLPG